MGGATPNGLSLYTHLLNFGADSRSPIDGQTLEQRKAATKLYLDQLAKVVTNEPDKQPPKKDTY